jgi:YqaJ-like viral recombinase domain
MADLPEIVMPPSAPNGRKRKFFLLADYETIRFDYSVYTKEVLRPTETEVPTAVATTTESSDDEPQKNACTAEQLSAEAFYNAFVKRSFEECLIEAAAPQRSVLWHAARAYCITASNFGAAVGSNKYMSPDDLVLDKLWSSFKGNANTMYGTFHENDARESLLRSLDGGLHPTLEKLYATHFARHGTAGHYATVADEENVTYESFELIETGLLKHHEQPWMAVSPDGLLFLDGSRGRMAVLVEYKCPAAKRDSERHPYAYSPHNVPEYYYDQIQGIMGLLNKYPSLINVRTGPSHALFVVWQPRQHHVTLVPYDHESYNAKLEPALTRWYFDKYLPFAALKHNGALVPGTTEAAPIIEIL